MKHIRPLFLESPRVLTVPLTSSALALTVTVTQNNFLEVLFFQNYCISVPEKSVDIVGKSELIGKIALYVIYKAG